MLLSELRARGKAKLTGHPRTYRVAQSVYIWTKLLLDRAIFRCRHPTASFVLYSRGRVRELRDRGYHSQYGQDYFLWSTVLEGRRDGFFVDIGANHPVALSNSLFFEQQGWTGAAFEPLAVMEPLWREQRSGTALHRAAISDIREERPFVEVVSKEGWEHTLSGFRGCVRAEDVAMYGAREYSVQSGPLTDYVDVGQRIDLLMIDVEGAEEIVLRGIDFGSLRPAHVTVENVSRIGGSESVRRYLAAYGYRLVARVGAADDVFTFA